MVVVVKVVVAMVVVVKVVVAMVVVVKVVVAMVVVATVVVGGGGASEALLWLRRPFNRRAFWRVH